MNTRKQFGVAIKQGKWAQDVILFDSRSQADKARRAVRECQDAYNRLNGEYRFAGLVTLTEVAKAAARGQK